MNFKFRVARLVVKATTDSETKFDASQLEESEETRRINHKTILRYVNRDIHDARQIAHLQSRSRSGETVDPAHRPQASTHEGEGRRRNDHLFLSNADPEQVKAVLNRLESGAAFPVMLENGAEARLVGACGAFRPTDRTRLIKMRAVQNTVCDTPKASSVNGERIERARRLRNDPEPRDRGSKGYRPNVYAKWCQTRCVTVRGRYHAALRGQAEQSRTRRRVDTTDTYQSSPR